MSTELLTFTHYEPKTFESGKTATDFNTAEGRTFRAWEAPVASLGVATLNTPVTVEYSQKPSKDGRFVNTTIHSIAPTDSSVGAQAVGGSVTPGEASSAPPTAGPNNFGLAKPVDWDAKDQRITRAHGSNVAIQAVDVAIRHNLWKVPEGEDPVEAILKKAISAAYLPAGYSWAGPSK